MSNFILSAFADEISDDLEIQMDELDRHGIRYVEFRAAGGKNVAAHTEREAQAVRRKLDGRGFRVSAVGSPVGKTYIDEDFEPVLEQLAHVVKLAGILGTAYIRVFSFYIPQGDDPAAWRGEVMKRMRAMADYAEKQGVVLLHENERLIWGDTAERCRDILDTVDSPALWATYDPSNFVHCGVRNYPYAFNLLRDRIKYLHMKDSVYTTEDHRPDKGYDKQVVSDAHRPVGLGDGNCREILTDLWKEGFEGFLSIEPHLVNNPDVPGGPADKFAVAADALKKLIASIRKEVG